ncbi:hypothetical protein ACI77O_12550 [Pseudomonas tritici]|uniref:hypothetical protein n=1 Tax=Pseudomonas tritici TaxID=2745518 RepID=UPI00387B49F4
MSIICEFGSAPDLAKAGYQIIGTTSGTDDAIVTAYAGQKVKLVRGPTIFGEAGKSEFAVMGRVQSVQVKHWNDYGGNSDKAFTHQIDIEDQRISNGQCYFTVGAVEGNVDDLLSASMEVNTDPVNGVDLVPCMHVHFDSDALAFTAFKVNDKIVVRLEHGVTLDQIAGQDANLYSLS